MAHLDLIKVITKQMAMPIENNLGMKSGIVGKKMEQGHTEMWQG